MGNFRIITNIFFMLVLLNAYAFAFDDTRLEILNFEIDFDNKSLILDFDFKKNEKIHIKADFVKDDEYVITANIRNLNLGLFELISDLHGVGKIFIDNHGYKKFKGVLHNSMSFINRKPIKDISVSYQLNKDRLTINSLKWDKVKIEGFIGLNMPYQTQVNIQIKDLDTKDYAMLIGSNAEDPKFCGIINALVYINGPLNNLSISGYINAKEGRFSSIIFESANFNIEGVYPTVKLVNSHMWEESGVNYKIDGEFNLEEIFKGQYKNANQPQVALVSKDVFRWYDWLVSRKTKSGEDDTVEIKYQLKTDNYLNFRIKEDEESFGWQKNIRF